MIRSLTIEDIRVVLPHRRGMLLLAAAEIDTDAESGTSRLVIGESAWCVGLACPHLFLAEAVAQLSGVTLAWLAVDRPDAGALGYFAEIPEMRLGAAPMDGDIIDLHVRQEIAFGPLARFEVRATRGREEVLTGSVTIAVDPGDHQA